MRTPTAPRPASPSDTSPRRRCRRRPRRRPLPRPSRRLPGLPTPRIRTFRRSTTTRTSKLGAHRVRDGSNRSADAAGADVSIVFSNLEAVRRTAARTTLSGLMMWLGEPGLDVAGASPALLAVLDQHAAQLRDSLGDSADGPNIVAHAGYATDNQDALIDAGWTLAAIPA